jgi:hypothetical protein
MKSGDGFVAVVHYDPNAVLDKFVGRDPTELAAYLQDLLRSGANHIERCRPDNYQARGEVHQIVWIKGNHDQADLITSIFRLFLSLLRELRRVNADYREKGLPPARFYAGLSEGRVELDSQAASGEGVANAYRCAENARAKKAILVVSAGILKDQGVGFSLSDCVSEGYFTIEEDALSAMAR